MVLEDYKAYFPQDQLDKYNHLAEVSIYTQSNEELLQKSGDLCHYFSIDSCLMLSTQMNYANIYAYMFDHGQLTIEDNRIVVKSPLPPRIKRGSEVYDDETRLLTTGRELFRKWNDKGSIFKLKGLKSTIFDEQNASKEIVDKKQRTAAQSIEKNLIKLEVFDVVLMSLNESETFDITALQLLSENNAHKPILIKEESKFIYMATQQVHGKSLS